MSCVAELIRPTDTLISYLPLAHVFERIMQAALYFQGAAVGFYRGVRQS